MAVLTPVIPGKRRWSCHDLFAGSSISGRTDCFRKENLVSFLIACIRDESSSILLCMH